MFRLSGLVVGEASTGWVDEKCNFSPILAQEMLAQESMTRLIAADHLETWEIRFDEYE
jgi:hypothetical protein